MSENQTILLGQYKYCHIENLNTGKKHLVEGPGRTHLEGHEKIDGDIKNKIRLHEGKWVCIHNPYDAQAGTIREGEEEIRIGPVVFSLHPGEEHSGIKNEYILTDDDALLLKARREVPDPRDENETLAIGKEILLKGPCRYIPHRHIQVLEERRSKALAEDQGVYVQNHDTGKVRLVRGETDLILDHNESLWNKNLTTEESEALGYEEQEVDDESRVLAAQPRLRRRESDAVIIELEDNEAIYIYDDDDSRVVFGAKTVFLQPHERPKVLFISGNVPVRPNVLRIAKLGLGPDFIRDRLSVRTRDNATLDLDVTFRWRFIVDKENPKKLFALKDFVGFTAQTLSSEIREAAAQHTFDEFHSKAGEVIKNTVFGDKTSRLFDENGLEIFGVDVEGITPEDPEIRERLATAIKTNVDIYTARVQQEARLDSERRLIEGQAKNEEARKALIELQIANNHKQQIEAAKTEAEALKTQAAAEAEAITLKAQAQRQAEEERLKAITKTLAGNGGKEYIALEQAKFGQNAKKVLVVPTDSQLRLNFGQLIPEIEENEAS